MKRIILIGIFSVFFQISTQFLTTSEESSDDDSDSSSSSSSSCSSSSSSGSSSEEKPAKLAIGELKQLNGEQRKQFVKKFLLHLMSIAELQAEERLITGAMRQYLPQIFNAKMNYTGTWKKLLKTTIEGEKVLLQILEQKTNLTKSDNQAEKPKILQFFEHAWDEIEKKKFNEAMSVFQKINKEITDLGRKQLPSLHEQRRAAFTIDHLIQERSNIVDKESREIREKLKAAPKFEVENTTTTTPVSWMLNADDIASIRKQYEEMIDVIPDASHPEAIKLKELLKKEGMSIPYFCKTLAEMQNMVSKFHSCVLKNDQIGKEILKDTLKQPDFKKCWNLFQECALNMLHEDEQIKEHLRKQSKFFLFDTSK